MAEVVAEHGYAKTSVAQVLRRAGVSRESFYEQFANKEDCFLAAYDEAATVLLGIMAAGLAAPEPEADPAAAELPVLEQLSRVLRSYLAALAAEPAIARTFFVEVYAAGDAALRRRVDVQARFVDAMATLVDARDDTDRFAVEALVAAISALVTQRVCAGRFDELEALHGPVVGLVARVLGEEA
ncbi:TetR/AcrR family transcriptional regulator [Paraconexibacter algicola]|uniref:TetR/AcrR family transcriptional regulator n=2 Tax=Paraconexibacter algicola TaxID=2133960 RepID=A0A2T4UE79_9ACTN|nr:TetR/AcrR family transcriptional regulator [Paraconexibacter algicola]